MLAHIILRRCYYFSFFSLFCRMRGRMEGEYTLEECDGARRAKFSSEEGEPRRSVGRNGANTSWPLKNYSDNYSTVSISQYSSSQRSANIPTHRPILSSLLFAALGFLQLVPHWLESLPILRINSSAASSCPPRRLPFGSAKRPVYRIPYCAIRYGWMTKKDSIQ